MALRKSEMVKLPEMGSNPIVFCLQGITKLSLSSFAVVFLPLGFQMSFFHSFSISFFLKFILRERERERESMRMCAHRGGAERERERERENLKQAPCCHHRARLGAQSHEP